MLRVNVGLSRKVSKDYNSTGFSINLDGEVSSPVSDPEAVIAEVKQLYDVAQEALDREIERYQSDSAIASRDVTQTPTNVHPPAAATNRIANQAPAANGTGNGSAPSGEGATNKQIQYLLNLGKRQGLTPQQLEQRIEQQLGRQVGVYQLTKREAGDVIDNLSQSTTAVANGNGRGRTR